MTAEYIASLPLYADRVAAIAEVMGERDALRFLLGRAELKAKEPGWYRGGHHCQYRQDNQGVFDVLAEARRALGGDDE